MLEKKIMIGKKTAINIFMAIAMLLLLQVPVFAATTLQTGNLTQDKNGIHLNVNQEPLSQVLQVIGEQSGIAFSYPDDLADTPMSADIQSENWQSLVTSLLEYFSKMEFWTDDPASSRVKIVGLGEYDPGEATVARSKPKVVVAPSGKSDKTKSRKDRRRRARELKNSDEMKEDPNHPLAKLPAHILMEPGILNYIVASNVDIPEAIKRKYGLDRDGSNLPKNYPIPPHILHDPALETFLNEVGLPMPPQFPDQ
ncbi:MAG: hypothetical protein G3M70_05105 [Candidatus Nitronauta litoralis]|uniref:Uncharacterized protein n=1 Tax=Candidatus Nitronauta litoralis TaxID=2705533 RepID=A0A7T0BUQ4_9BACT|nr:MAG: hypothetical protein G3M70_05105 [Candidatus Nitronauta litoralis]